MFTARYRLGLNIQFRLFVAFKWLSYSQGEFANYEPSGHYMYRQFNIQQFYVLPTQCIYVLCGSENEQRLFPYTVLTDWFL